MTRTRRTLVSALALVIASGALAACSGDKNNTQRDKVLRYLAATRATARKFTYADQPLNGSTLELVGIIEDDYRYKVQFSLNGAPVREEIALDDALAVRFLDASTIGPSVDPDGLRKAQAKAAAAPAPKPGVESIPALPLETLQAGRWVVDPVGAPSLAIRSDQRNEGEDPILDALTVLDYVSEVVRAAPGMVKFNPEALEPTYKDEEDPFDKPERGAEISRWDVPLQDFPRATVAGSGGSRASFVPEANNFRKLAIFVKDEKVVRIDEFIDVEARIQDFKDAFEISGELEPASAVSAINEVRKARGRKDLLRPRRMVVTFPDLGLATEAIALPDPGTFTKGELSFLKGRGRLSARDRAAAASGATATTVAAEGAPADGATADTTASTAAP